MSGSPFQLCGWIGGCKKDQYILEEIGIILGIYNEKLQRWENCVVTGEQLRQLDSHWCIEFIWGLQ